MSAQFYQCPVCEKRSYNLIDIRERYCAACCAFEDDQRRIVTDLVLNVAKDCRGNLMVARGGIQALTPVQALEFGKTLGQLDRFISFLEGKDET